MKKTKNWNVLIIILRLNRLHFTTVWNPAALCIILCSPGCISSCPHCARLPHGHHALKQCQPRSRGTSAASLEINVTEWELLHLREAHQSCSPEASSCLQSARVPPALPLRLQHVHYPKVFHHKVGRLTEYSHIMRTVQQHHLPFTTMAQSLNIM